MSLIIAEASLDAGGTPPVCCDCATSPRTGQEQRSDSCYRRLLRTAELTRQCLQDLNSCAVTDLHTADNLDYVILFVKHFALQSNTFIVKCIFTWYRVQCSYQSESADLPW